MSGGVDSSVAAALLVEQGYDVTGVMLKLWRGEEINHASGCCSLDAASDARRVADALGIDFYVLNFAERFERSVVADFNSQYRRGRTPNPCVRCNHWIKFGALLERAEALGARYLATGHYARVAEGPGGFRLLRGVDRAKDQSYVLWMLTQKQLGRVLFPVGAMDKARTRALAAELGLRTARKPDSQEICFVRNGDFGAYAERHLGVRPGPVIDRSGRVLGEHAGVARYTVGQRRGLGIALGEPLYVTALDPVANAVVVGRREELAVAALETDETSFTAAALEPGDEVLVQHRAHGEALPARVVAVCGARLRLVLDAPAEAVAPGQSAAFYSPADPDELLGGGVIAATTPA
jgi:tRNA-specific 2-thiouridylase